MKDLFEQINNNQLEILGRRRKANKGSKLARYALKEAMGGDDSLVDGGFYGSGNSTIDDFESEFDGTNELDFENL